MKTEVLLVGHGTVDDLDDLPAFLKNVRRGKDAPDSLVRELRHRYETIGGSPLNAISARVAEKLERAIGVPVRAASRLWKPYPRDVIAKDTERVIVIPLAQHSSRVYADAARRDLEGKTIVAADDWGSEPALLDAFAERALEHASKQAALVLTAHSLPKHVIEAGDAYEREARAAARGVIDRVGDRFGEALVAFQSQGPGSDASEWLGPTIEATLDDVARRFRRVVFAPIGFLADHVEILHDLDVEAKAMAEARGLSFSRTRSLNDDDDFVAVLATIFARVAKERA